MTYSTKKWLTLIFTAILAIALPLNAEAREIYSLNPNWKIYAASDGSADNAYNISLPHCWNKSGEMAVSHATMDYLRSIYAPAEWLDKRVFVKFYGVQSAAELFINGRYVGEHRGGATAFVFEISNFLKINNDNDLIVKVNAIPQSDLLPTSIEHERYGGIYRDVELIVTPKTAFATNIYGADGLFVTTTSISDNKGKIKVEGEVKLHILSDEDTERDVELTISDQSGEVKFSKSLTKTKIGSGTTTLSIPFEVANAQVWSTDNPALYNVTATMQQQSATKGSGNKTSLEDQISTTTGFRTVGLAVDGGVKGCVRVNNAPQLFRGVSYMHDNPERGGITTAALLTRDIEQFKDLGINAIRSAIVPHNQRLYEMCDREGIMVWVDSPLVHSRNFSDVAYYPTTGFEENGIQQLNEIIHQNYNHPSIMMWGIFSLLNANDANAMRYINKLNGIAKNIDKSRPTVAISNQNGDINDVTDLIVWQQDLGWSRGLLSDIVVWQNQLHSSWSRFRSAVAYGAGGRVDHQEDRSELVYRRGRLTDDWLPEVRQSRLHEEYSKALVPDSLFWGMWVNSIYDYSSPRSKFGYTNEGLVTFDRQTKKDAYYLYRALWNDKEQTLHIVDKRNNLLIDSIVSLRVYASEIKDSNPKITIDGKEAEMTNIAPAQYIYENIRVTDQSVITVKHGQATDSVVLIYGSPLRRREYQLKSSSR
ncbi:MAG: glycoside hydrolase family 2 TIM barrel-domain containing protein [Rikenellaceae bacterium]